MDWCEGLAAALLNRSKTSGCRRLCDCAEDDAGASAEAEADADADADAASIITTPSCRASAIRQNRKSGSGAAPGDKTHP
ncbi:MAG: hypothetical protein QE278_07410 [Limnobacter sp.]|nr:hypothetical protein [Limnobacter sp.]